MVKKKSGNKKTNNTASTIPPATNGGTSDATSPTASSFAKEDQKDVSEPVQDEPKNATSPTEKNSTTDAATTAAPLSKSQKKKAAAARKAAAALANDNASSQQPTITEEVDTPTTPIESSEAKSNMTKAPSDEPEASEPLKDMPAPEPENDLEGDAWGLNEGEPSKTDHDVTRPAADEAPAPGAQDRSSADGIQVATVEPKSEDDIPKNTEVSNADEAAESPVEVSSDTAPNSSNDATDPDASDAHGTKNDVVIPSTTNENITKPNGTSHCEPMDAPPRPSDDDNTTLSQPPIREKPIVDTSFVSNDWANDSTTKQTPSLAGENPGSSQSGSGSSITGTGVFSNSHSRTDAPSTSPTSGVPARGPTAAGFGAAAPQTPTTTPGFGFGFGSPQGSIPKTASGMSWSSPSKPPPKPTPKTGWGWFNKARESIEQAIGDEPTAGPRAPSASVDRPAQSPLVGPSNSNSNPNATPASPSRPTKGMSALDLRLAALSKKAATGPNKDSAPAPTPETPKTSSFTMPPSDPGASPVSPLHSTQSYTQSHPSPLPLPPSTSEPTEQTAPQTPDQAVVTSAFPSPPRENTAETGNVGKLIAKFDDPETPISSKTATTGLRLHTQSIVPDSPVGASPVTKRASIGSETERPSLADMRSSFAPTPKTPITSASPRTPNYNFGPGLGTTNRLGGGFRLGGGGFGFRPNHAPSPMSTPLTEKNEPKLGNQNDRDDLSSLIEGSEPQDLDSQIGESEPQDLDSLIDDSGLDGLANIPLNIDVDSPAIPTTFNTTIPDVAPSYANPWDSPPVVTAEVLPATTLEVIAPLPSPTKSEFGPDAAIPDDKTIADPSDLADVTPEPTPKDEPQPESPVVSDHVVTPVAEKPTEVPSLEERAVEELAVPPVVEESATSPIADEPTVPPVVDEPTEAPVLHDEALVPELTEPATALEPQVDEPPPAISTEETPQAPKEPVAEPVIETVVEPTIGPSVEPAAPVVEPTVEPVVEPVVGVAEPTADVVPESSPESTIKTVVETVIEPTPEPTVQPVVELPELVVVPSVEVVSEPVAEQATAEPSIELSSETVTEPAVEPVATVVESAVKPITEVVAESIPEAIPEPAELTIETPVELTPEPVAQPVVEPSEPTAVPLIEPATIASTLESLVKPSPEPAVEPVVELIATVVEPVVESAVVEPVEVVAEPTPEVTPKPASEPAIETPVEPTPEPVVQPVVEPAEPTVVPLVEPVTIASTLEPTTEPPVEPLLASRIEPPVPESAPVLPTETAFEKSEPPKLSLDVPSAGKSSKSKSKSKLKSPAPPTPITPATPVTSGKKNGKNGKNGKGKKSKNGKKEEVATSEPIPIVPEAASQSEPASKSELISQFIPGPTPMEPEAEPIRAGSVELIPEVVELAPIVEVSPPPEAPEEPEPTPEDVPSTLVEKSEQPEAEIVEVVEPAVVELAVVEPPVIPVVAESAVVESAVVEPVSIEPIAIEPVSVEPVLAESAMVEPVADKPLALEPAAVESVEVTLPPTIQEITKNEDSRTATPDEDFETPKVAPRELPELVPEHVEATPQTFVFEAPIEATIIPPAEAESSPEPILLPPSTEAYAQFIPALEPQPEPEPELAAVPIVEPAVDPVVEAVTEPPVDVVAEAAVELAYKPVSELTSVPTVEPVAELKIAPSTEDITIEEIQPVAEVVPELQAQPPVEPVFEVAVSPVVEAPKEEEPTPEVHRANPSPSKSSKKKKRDKKKGAAKAVVTEEPVLSPVNDDPVVEVVKPEVPITSTLEESKVSNEIVVFPALAPMEESSVKAKVISVVSTPVEETLPTLPLSAEAPMALVDTPQLEEMEEALVTTTQTIEVLESPIQTEVTPEIEVIELPDDQDTEAASIISVAQIHPEVTMSTQLTLPAIELAPIELVPDVLYEPEPVPVLVDLPQSPVTSALSAPSPRPITPSLWPQEPFLANREASPPRSVTPNTDKHHETLAALQIPTNPIRIPVRPVLEHVVSAEVTIPLSASPISDSASQSSQDIGSSGREDSGVPRESQPLRRTGSVSSITSIDTDSPSVLDKSTMRPSMPPLISVPVPSPVATSSPYLGSLTQRSSPERKSSAKSDERPAPSTATNDLPTNDVPSKLDTNAKPSSSRILDNFSPLRWFGFGGLPTPAAENKPVEVRSVEAKPVEAPVEVNSVEVSPIEVKLVEVKPVDAHPVETNPVETNPVETNPVEISPVEPEPIETKPVEIKATEAEPVETNPVEVRSVEVHPVVAAPADPKAKNDREKQPKSTLVPIRKVASPPSPESPIMEKTGWSRWPYQPTMITSIPPVKARVPLARDSIPAPTRADGHTASPRSGRVPPISTMPPIIPISPIPAGSPSAPARSDALHSRRSHRTNGQTTHLFSTPVHVQATSIDEEKRERSGKRLSPRATSPMLNPAAALQSPRSSEDSLPAYTSQAPSVDRDPKPVPRGILKQRITPPATPPEANTPTTANSARATPQPSKFEFTGLRAVPSYDIDYSSSVRKDTSSTNIPRSREAQPPLATMASHSSRSRTMGDSNHRSRLKHSSKELGSLPNKVNRPRTPSPLRGTSKTAVTPPKPNLVPVFNEKIIRTKALKPAKISTARTTGDAYIQPLISPILLTSENYGARQPENKVYQYDGISPSESLSPTSRKAIFDILQKQVAPQVFPILARPNFDGKKMLYAQRRLNVSSKQEFSVELLEHGQEPRVYTVQLKRLAVITPQIALTFR